ncbi:hypothetical protein ACHAWF_015532 [Thalassiosira exigua]
MKAQPPRPLQVQQLLPPFHRDLLQALVRHQRLERRVHHVERISIPVTLCRRVGDPGVLEDLADEGMAVQAVVRGHGAEVDLARVVLPREVEAQPLVEVPIDVEDVALAVLARLLDGLVGGVGLGHPEPRGAVAVPPDDEGAIPDRRPAPLDLLDPIDLDGALRPRSVRLAVRVLPVLDHLEDLVGLLLPLLLPLVVPSPGSVSLRSLLLREVVVHVLLLDVHGLVRLVELAQFHLLRPLFLDEPVELVHPLLLLVVRGVVPRVGTLGKVGMVRGRGPLLPVREVDLGVLPEDVIGVVPAVLPHFRLGPDELVPPVAVVHELGNAPQLEELPSLRPRPPPQRQVLRRPLLGREAVDGAEVLLHLQEGGVGLGVAAPRGLVQPLFEGHEVRPDGVGGVRAELLRELVVVIFVFLFLSLFPRIRDAEGGQLSGRVLALRGQVILYILQPGQIRRRHRLPHSCSPHPAVVVHLLRLSSQRIQRHPPPPPRELLHRHVRIAVHQVRVVHRPVVQPVVVVEVVGGDPSRGASLAPPERTILRD